MTDKKKIAVILQSEFSWKDFAERTEDKLRSNRFEIETGDTKYIRITNPNQLRGMRFDGAILMETWRGNVDKLSAMIEQLEIKSV